MSSFVDHLLGLLVDFAPVRAKRMFGGHGLFIDELMIAIVIDDVLYLKVDAGNRERFIERGLSPFEYHAKGKRVSLSYYRAPEEVLDESEVAIEWARSAFEAALRSRVESKPKSRPRTANKAVAKRVGKAVKAPAKQAAKKVATNKVVAKQSAPKTAKKPTKQPTKQR